MVLRPTLSHFPQSMLKGGHRSPQTKRGCGGTKSIGLRVLRGTVDREREYFVPLPCMQHPHRAQPAL
jgi:hypothetical protein